MTDRYEQISWYRMIGDGYESGKFFVSLSEQRVPVTGWDGALGYVSTADGDDPEDRIPRYIVERFGRFERRVPEHPHGVVRQEIGSVIRLGNGKLAVRVDNDEEPWQVIAGADSIPVWLSDGELQERADYHGFTPLGDVEAAREEGRKAGIRAVYESLDKFDARRSREYIRLEFPEAFEGGESR